MTDRPPDILEFKRGPVISERRGSTLVLSLNRPERLNAVNAPLYELLERFVEEGMAEEEVRCVVITGQGRAFCAGADLKAHSGDGPPAGPELEYYIHLGQRVNRLLQVCPKPVVAAVNGPAVGAGLELALSADFMVVADDAKLRLPEISLGTFVGGGAVYTIAERGGGGEGTRADLPRRLFLGCRCLRNGIGLPLGSHRRCLGMRLGLGRQTSWPSTTLIRLGQGAHRTSGRSAPYRCPGRGVSCVGGDNRLAGLARRHACIPRGSSARVHGRIVDPGLGATIRAQTRPLRSRSVVKWALGTHLDQPRRTVADHHLMFWMPFSDPSQSLSSALPTIPPNVGTECWMPWASPVTGVPSIR